MQTENSDTVQVRQLIQTSSLKSRAIILLFKCKECEQEENEQPCLNAFF